SHDGDGDGARPGAARGGTESRRRRALLPAGAYGDRWALGVRRADARARALPLHAARGRRGAVWTSLEARGARRVGACGHFGAKCLSWNVSINHSLRMMPPKCPSAINETIDRRAPRSEYSTKS